MRIWGIGWLGRPSFWEGIARIVDLGGTLSDPLPDSDYQGWNADQAALAEDWRVVLDDLLRFPPHE